MTLDDQIREIVRAETAELRAKIEQLEAQNQRPAEVLEALPLDRASERFGVSPATLRAWIKDGSLPASRRKVRGHWYVEPADVLAKMRSMRTSVPAASRANLQAVPDMQSEVARMLSGEHKQRGGRRHG